MSHSPGQAEPPETAAPRQARAPFPAGTGPVEPATLRILILEDDPADAELEQRLLKTAGIDFTAVVVDTKASYVAQLSAFRPDVILADFSLPGFSGTNALEIMQEQSPEVPFILLSGAIGDEAAVELIKQGATDYVLKDRPARLAPVVRRAVAEAEQRLQLARLEAHLQRAQRLESIGQLAAGVAHEFNNQVGAMLNYAAFIREEAAARSQQAPAGDGWDGVRRDAEGIEQAGRRVIRLVHQLLAAGSHEMLRTELVDLNYVLGEIGELVRSTVGPGIEFQLSLAPDLWTVTADSGQIEQVLLSLATNARDAMLDGGSYAIETRNVMIGAGSAPRLELPPGAYVCLTARDTGEGMAPEVLEHVFEPFFTTKPLVEGGGLGLASMYGMIRQAGGTVEVSSRPGAGTTITIWLPASTAGSASSLHNYE
jgi:two-component system, cell cycle sensor histidine kinase and response regulator CckA